MPRRTSSAPKHRAAGPRTASPDRAASPAPAAQHRLDRPAATRRLGIALAVTGAAVATTGAAATGVLPLAPQTADVTAAHSTTVDLTAAQATARATALTPARAAALRERGETQVSRSARRTAVDPRKAALLRDESTSGGQVSRTEELGGGDPRTIAQALLPQFGFGSDQFSCLDALWTKESGWNVHADNPTSSAYGIPQSLPGEKMATVGADWADNPATQIRWGLGYIKASYGSPCGAWAHSQSYNWY